MISNLFAVQDIKAGSFHPPFISENKETAMRFLGDMVAREGHPYNLHPEDYTCFWIGAFDLVSGAVSPGQLESVVNLASLKG